MAELILAVGVNAVLGALLWAILLWKAPRDKFELGGPEGAMREFRAVFPEATGTASVSDDNRTALIDLQLDDQIGLLQRQGRRWNARILFPYDISSVRPDPNGALEITLSDFGWPRASIVFSDTGIRAIWLTRLTSLTALSTSRTSPEVRNA